MVGVPVVIAFTYQMFSIMFGMKFAIYAIMLPLLFMIDFFGCAFWAPKMIAQSSQEDQYDRAPTRDMAATKVVREALMEKVIGPAAMGKWGGVTMSMLWGVFKALSLIPVVGKKFGKKG